MGTLRNYTGMGMTPIMENQMEKERESKWKLGLYRSLHVDPSP